MKSRPALARTLVSAATVVALAAGCTAADPGAEPPAAPAASPTASAEGAPQGFEDLYAQAVDWADCGDGFDCATVKAPLSWHDAAAGTIDLALKRHRATGDRQGALLVNPGGPGGSGVDYVGYAWPTFGERLREAYDVVGFDPRGVGGSTRVTCFDDARKDVSLAKDFDTTTDEGLEAMAAEYAAWGAACEKNTGELLANVDTQSAARDMDLLRSVLGEGRLNYLGFSYGTQLGATYAGLFPDRVGAMVLDGAIDTTLDADQISAGQAAGFEQALRNYVADCQGGDGCPLKGDVDDGMRTVRHVLDRALTDPYPTSGSRRVTRNLAFYGIAVTLYAQESWPSLTQALDEVLTQGTADTLLYLADFYNDRADDGTFSSNSAEGFRAVGCLDSRGTTDVAEMRAQLADIEKTAPTVGTFFGFTGLVCRDWPVPVVAQEFDLHATGAPPIVVIGTTHDPATPYAWAEGLAKTLDSGVLVTYDGEGHTAYARSNDCVLDAVDSFFVDGVVPADGLRC
ncbi:alpha/beta hydrolase [Xylanimonas protaetiae]|uniref:Alpha/beta hydrolase n=1 Tax=Xylanimonas protaetiae TaxID=2509457 RepID=A0A4P6F2W7_9MICO|nr:alpha/beta hydrolase [Xylanimonas protaetiae]QAY69854.1 alpha/beta hydrolase [Xylanimonas protaetiae]